MLLVNVICSWVFVRFIHYHSQYTPVAPDHYVFDLVTKEEFAKMSDPTVTEVALSDGRYFVKSPGWHGLNMPQYYTASADGRYYVEVTTKGTAHFAGRWGQDMCLILIPAIPALVLSLWNQRNTRFNRDQLTVATEAPTGS
jgi:hypothetical protein